MKQKLIILALLLVVLVQPAFAVINVAANQTTASSITWQWAIILTATNAGRSILRERVYRMTTKTLGLNLTSPQVYFWNRTG
jgi:hypothetical protein